jgi:hypothetical protein
MVKLCKVTLVKVCQREYKITKNCLKIQCILDLVCAAFGVGIFLSSIHRIDLKVKQYKDISKAQTV